MHEADIDADTSTVEQNDPDITIDYFMARLSNPHSPN